MSLLDKQESLKKLQTNPPANHFVDLGIGDRIFALETAVTELETLVASLVSKNNLKF